MSLEVQPGRIVGLIGPNGAGKTTLFNVITGLLPAAGTVSFDGRDISRLRPHRRAALGIGRSFQNLGLMPDETVLTNVLAAQHLGAGYLGVDVVARPWRWARGETALHQRAERVLAALELTPHRHDRIADVSFGTARFVELACVLAERPALMLLDEPTTGLDVSETRRLTDLLVTLRRAGTTVLVVAHDVRFVMTLSDEVYVLAEGRVLRHGAPADIQRDPAVAAVYLGQVA